MGGAKGLGVGANHQSMNEVDVDEHKYASVFDLVQLQLMEICFHPHATPMLW